MITTTCLILLMPVPLVTTVLAGAVVDGNSVVADCVVAAVVLLGFVDGPEQAAMPTVMTAATTTTRDRFAIVISATLRTASGWGGDTSAGAEPC
ncbi:MAG: hypothetical protein JO085_00990 [Acidimicrobiia bacterium]|nr:hypothetical protein [Acidimicrobiia bacterium]